MSSLIYSMSDKASFTNASGKKLEGKVIKFNLIKPTS